MTTVKPFLRWAGSKRSVVKKLSENAPSSFSKYIEAFVGSGALFFHLNPKQAVLSDLNWDVVNLFNQVKTSPEELHQLLTNLKRNKDTYLAVRESFGTETNDLNRAVSMLFLNRNCFNGLFRTNKAGKFNVPYAAQGRGNYPTIEELVASSQRLENVRIIHGDFHTVVSREVQNSDFVYLDPPYVKSEGRIFNEYVKGHFNHGDTERLAQLLREIHSKGAFFLLSFIDDPIVRDIAEEWGYETYLVQKNIAGFAASRRRSPEILVRNW